MMTKALTIDAINALSIVLVLLSVKTGVLVASSNDQNRNAQPFQSPTLSPPTNPPPTSYLQRFFTTPESENVEDDNATMDEFTKESLHYRREIPPSDAETESSTFPLRPWSVGRYLKDSDDNNNWQDGSNFNPSSSFLSAPPWFQPPPPSYYSGSMLSDDQIDTTTKQDGEDKAPFHFFHNMWDKILISRRSGATAAGEQVGERVGAKLIERSGENLAKRAIVSKKGVNAIARSSVTKNAASATAKRSVAGHVAKVGVEHASEATLMKGAAKSSSAYKAGKIVRRSTGRISRSVGRAFLITLPALGGFFAISLLKADLKRMAEVQEEQDDWDWRTTGTLSCHNSRKRHCLPSLLFGGAAGADFVDALCHFMIAYAFLVNMEYSRISWLEEISFVCAAFSLFCAVSGEVIGYQRMKKRNGLN